MFGTYIRVRLNSLLSLSLLCSYNGQLFFEKVKGRLLDVPYFKPGLQRDVMMKSLLLHFYIISLLDFLLFIVLSTLLPALARILVPLLIFPL